MLLPLHLVYIMNKNLYRSHMKFQYFLWNFVHRFVVVVYPIFPTESNPLGYIWVLGYWAFAESCSSVRDTFLGSASTKQFSEGSSGGKRLPVIEVTHRERKLDNCTSSQFEMVGCYWERARQPLERPSLISPTGWHFHVFKSAPQPEGGCRV